MNTTRGYFTCVAIVLSVACTRSRAPVDELAHSPTVPQGNSVTEPPVDTPDPTAREPQETDGQRFERVFQAEFIDSTWANKREVELRDGFKSRIDLLIQRLECRSTICRVQVSVVADSGAVLDFIGSLRRIPGHEELFNGSTMHFTQTSDSAGVFYVTRRDYGLPNSDGTPNIKGSSPSGLPSR
jgi:hypothetical protein